MRENASSIGVSSIFLGHSIEIFVRDVHALCIYLETTFVITFTSAFIMNHDKLTTYLKCIDRLE